MRQQETPIRVRDGVQLAPSVVDLETLPTLYLVVCLYATTCLLGTRFSDLLGGLAGFLCRFGLISS